MKSEPVLETSLLWRTYLRAALFHYCKSDCIDRDHTDEGEVESVKLIIKSEQRVKEVNREVSLLISRQHAFQR